ncbi:MAG: hypothetical protein Kow0031_16940 [Anaerolineae bacterium]
MPRKRILIVLLLAASVIFSGQSSVVIAQEDLAVISNPASNAVLRGTVEISGSADYPSFQFYILEFSPEPIAGDQWQIIGQIREAPVTNGVLETWNTTLVPDGSYTIRLRVVRLDGNYSEAFVQQVVVANAQPEPTNTPTVSPDATELPVNLPPTTTPTPLPPTPTIVIEQPVVDTPTPRPIPTTPPLEDPDEESGSLIPTVTGFSVSPLWDACLYGSGLMVSIFLLFGFLSALRHLIISFINRRRGI